MSDLYTTTSRYNYGVSSGDIVSNYNNIPVYQRYSQNSDTYAEDVYADLIRDEYQDYEERFAPVQGQYLDLATSMELLDEQLGRITANTKQGFESADLANRMTMDRYGVKRSNQNVAENKKTSDLNSALATASAKNSTRTHHKDRQMAMMTGGNIPSIRNDISSGASSSSPVAT